MKDQHEQWQYLVQLLAPQRGEVILDLGCGSGKGMLHLLNSSRVQKVVGLDISEEAIERAKRRLARYVRIDRAELILDDASRGLPFGRGAFDAVLSAELIECLGEAAQRRLLREVHRVLKPGGRILVEHTDWDTQLWSASDRQLERKLVHAFCDWKQAWMQHSDGWMGRNLLGLFRRAKLFTRVKVSAHTLINDRYKPGTFGYARSQDLIPLARKGKRARLGDVRRFIRDMRARDRAKSYFYSVNRFVVTATKKGS